MPAFNARLLERCLDLGDKDHYRKGGRETDLSARGPQSTAGAAGDTLRRGRVETHEGRQVRDRHRRGQAPVRGRPRACGARADRRAARVRGRAAVATGPGPGPTARSGRRFPTRCANGSTGRRARSSPRGCARPGRPNARADGRTRWRRWPRSTGTTGGIDRAGVCLAAARHAAGTEPVAYDEPVDPTRIRPGVRREGGQRMSQRNEERTDVGPAAGEGPRPVRLPSHHRRPAGMGHAQAAPGRRQAAAHGTGATARPRSAPGSCAAPGSPSPRRWTATVFTNVKLPDGYARDELLSQGLRRQGPGPRVLREDRTRQDPPGHRAGHERDRPGHGRTLPAHRRARPSAGPRQARGNPRRPCSRTSPKPTRSSRHGFGYVPFDVDGARLLYQVIAGSYERRSIILRHEHRVQANGARSSPTTNSPPRSSTASFTTDDSSSSPDKATAPARHSCSANPKTNKTHPAGTPTPKTEKNT